MALLCDKSLGHFIGVMGSEPSYLYAAMWLSEIPIIESYLLFI